jgi:hypothetical protein
MGKRLLGFFIPFFKYRTSDSIIFLASKTKGEINKLSFVFILTKQNELKDGKNILVLKYHLKGDFTMRLRQRNMAGMKEPFIKFLSETQSVSWQNNRP